MSQPDTKTYRAALQLMRANISFIPVKPADKAPAIPAWKIFQTERADETLAQEWFKNGNGIAIIGGQISGNLLILDFDVPGLYESFAESCADNGVLALNSCCVVKTPSGGNHVYFRSESPVGKNTKLARSANGECLIETRGEGGYALTSPTPGYQVLQGRPDNLPVLSEEDVNALLGIAQLFNEYLPERAGNTLLQEPEPTGRNSPGNDYNERGDYEAILQKHGWQPLYKRGDCITWVRPGKQERQASATTGFSGARMFYAFSTNAAPFDAERKYSPFSVYGLLEHGGDFTAAARKLGEMGYGEPAGEKFKRPSARKRTVADREVEEEQAEEQEQSKQFRYAQEWAELNKDRFIYLSGDQWFEYTNGYWLYSSAEDVQRSVQEYLSSVTSVTAALVGNVRTLAKSMVGPHKLADFNAHSNWIPLQNGVLDTLTGQLLPHSPENRVTYQTPYDYIPEADCPTWRRCLEEWLITEDGKPCQEWHDALQEWFGYCLIPDNSAQLSMMWVGEGANGKGTTTRALEQLIGKEFTTSIPIEMLHDPYHRAELYGKLVGFVNEPDPRAMIKNGNHFKAIVGGDSISARRPTEKVFTFTPMTRLVISCNELPTSKDLSRGYYRRLVLIDWRYNVPAEKRDPELDDKIKAELPGILNWALVGLARWRARGRKFIVPGESGKLLERYKLDQDSIGRFFQERCVFGKVQVPSAQFYQAYKQWCEEMGEKPEPDKAIASRLSKKGLINKSLYIEETKKTARVWLGVDLKEGDE